MSKQGRIRTRELHEARRLAAQRQARRRRMVTGLGVVLIVGLVAAIVLAVVNAAGGDGGRQAVADDVTAPANLERSGAYPVGDADAGVEVEIYYDYMCPACGRFEAANSGELDRLVEQGKARILLRPISFLDKFSQGTEYSTRAANAFATVVNTAPDKAWAFHSALYEQQPAEGSRGLEDDQIAQLARDAGVPTATVERFEDRAFSGWVESVTAQAFDSGVEGTPTVKIAGKVFDGDVYTVGPLTEAIETAASKQ